MTVEEQILHTLPQAVSDLYQAEMPVSEFNLQETRKEFAGQITVVTFPITRFSKKSPEVTGEELGAYLQNVIPDVVAFNVIKGFLNLSISDSYWINSACFIDFG